MTVEQYLRDQIAKNRGQSLVTIWGTDPTKHVCTSYDQYMHMYMNHGTYMRQSNNDRQSDDTQQYNTRVNNTIMMRLGDNTGTNSANMSQSKNGSGPKIIWTRSGQVNCRPQRLGNVENQ